MSDLVDQPTSQTTRKVTSAAVGGSAGAMLGSLVAAAIRAEIERRGVDITAESMTLVEFLVNHGVPALFTLAAGWLSGYRTRERASQQVNVAGK